MRSGVCVCVFQDLQYTPERPDVHFIAVALLAQHFGCNVVWSSTQGLLPLAIKLDLSGEAEVTWRGEEGDVCVMRSGSGYCASTS